VDAAFVARTAVSLAVSFAVTYFVWTAPQRMGVERANSAYRVALTIAFGYVL
jgi:hypothetical protein